MQKMRLKDIGMNICIAYTIISISVHLYEIMSDIGDLGQHINGLMMFFCTVVAVCCLSLYHVLEEWPPLLVILMQYILEVIIVLGTTYLLGRFDEISQGGYFDMWRSFTVIYILGATGYYIEILRYVKKQNKWIEEVKVEQKNRKNT